MIDDIMAVVLYIFISQSSFCYMGSFSYHIYLSFHHLLQEFLSSI